MPRVLISGGTGLIGSALSEKLREKGYEVTLLSRSKKGKDDLSVFQWDWRRRELEAGALRDTDYIIHLAGENILKMRWNKKGMEAITDSRVRSGRFLFEKVQETQIRLRAFISASAVGYYGAVAPEKIFSEEDPPGNDFLAEVCVKWEAMADQFITLGIRSVKIRTSPVLSAKGGALPQMITPLKIGVAPVMGRGAQYMPWIHIDDLCDIYIKAIEDPQMNGAYNAAAPDHRTNEQFVQTLARAMDKNPWIKRIPGFWIKLVFGKKASAMLGGSRVASDKIRSEGYSFKFPALEGALSDLLKKSNA